VGIKIANNASTAIQAEVLATDTAVTVTGGSGSLFPALGAGDFFYATLVSTAGGVEIVKVTSRTGDTMTVVRAQEGTVALPFPVYSRFELRVTAANLQAYVDSLDFLFL
jgi:hypothetical protein